MSKKYGQLGYSFYLNVYSRNGGKSWSPVWGRGCFGHIIKSEAVKMREELYLYCKSVRKAWRRKDFKTVKITIYNK